MDREQPRGSKCRIPGFSFFCKEPPAPFSVLHNTFHVVWKITCGSVSLAQLETLEVRDHILYSFLYLQKCTMNFIYKKGIPIPRSHPWSCLCFLKEMLYLEEAPLQQWESLPYTLLDIKMKVSPGYYAGNPCGRGEEGSTNRTGFRYKCIVNWNKNKIWCGNLKLLNETVMILIQSKTIIISTYI